MVHVFNDSKRGEKWRQGVSCFEPPGLQAKIAEKENLQYMK